MLNQIYLYDVYLYWITETEELTLLVKYFMTAELNKYVLVPVVFKTIIKYIYLMHALS